MNHIKQFIEDAIKGGFVDCNLQVDDAFYPIERNLLDPLAWKAVGKTRGWSDKTGYGDVVGTLNRHWSIEIHIFIDGLCSGLSIDDALKAISK